MYLRTPWSGIRESNSCIDLGKIVGYRYINTAKLPVMLFPLRGIARILSVPRAVQVKPGVTAILDGTPPENRTRIDRLRGGESKPLT
jgi:hypothetical protein